MSVQPPPGGWVEHWSAGPARSDRLEQRTMGRRPEPRKKWFESLPGADQAGPYIVLWYGLGAAALFALWRAQK